MSTSRKMKVGETITLSLSTCEYDSGRFQEAIYQLKQAIKAIEHLGYECEWDHYDDIVDEPEVLS